MTLVWRKLELVNTEKKYTMGAECGVVLLGWFIVLRY